MILGSRSAGSGQEEGLTAAALRWPGGRYLVAAIGVGVVGGAVVIGREAVTGTWRDNVDLDRCATSARREIAVLAVAGLLARGAVLGAIGVFVVRAAIRFTPREGVGLDGALHELAAGDHGTPILVAVAAGLFAYAGYSVVEAMLRPAAVT